MNYESTVKLLSRFGQEHLLRYYDELTDTERSELISQIKEIDFSILDSLKPENSHEHQRGAVSPLEAVTIDNITAKGDEYLNCGLSAIREGKVAAVLLAGGQGTRLGFDKAKGMFNIGVNRELYIFECLINNLMDVVKQSGTWIHFIIMTSRINNKETVEFLDKHNYFGYNKEYVHFFIQDMAPCVDLKGKILMESKSKIAMSPNGNGGWFSSLVDSGIFDMLKSQGVEWLNVFAVDNVLQRIADPMFVGAVISTGSDAGSKVVPKVAPEEKVGVMCLDDDKPSIIEYFELSDKMRNLRDDKGELVYKYGVILNYLFNMDCLVEINKNKLPIHISEKKIPHIDENGECIKPEKTNGYKFETLILDMIQMNKSCLPYEVIRSKEFAPVKNDTGADSVDTARELLIKNGVNI
ncbi:MAG: UDPGP type 1 family protein [Ruminococcus sp.]|nr:UDPGP type 1 family protein [Ruminococcus sp.]